MVAAAGLTVEVEADETEDLGDDTFTLKFALGFGDEGVEEVGVLRGRVAMGIAEEPGVALLDDNDDAESFLDFIRSIGSSLSSLSLIFPPGPPVLLSIGLEEQQDE